MLRPKAVAGLILLCAMLSHAHAQFEPGQFVTWSQDAWGGNPAVPGSAAALVSDRFFFVYPGGGVSVGVTSGSGRSMLFTAPQAVVTYLPTSGANAPLNATLVDPTSTAAGAFGGHLLALQLDIDFANAGYLPGLAGIPFGDLTLVNMSSVGAQDYSAFDGLTVRQFRDQMNIALGTSAAAYGFDRISYLTEEVTRAFEGGQPSQFAQNHLRVVPEPATLVMLVLAAAGVCSRRRRAV